MTAVPMSMRQGDIVLHVKQDNVARKVLIESVDETRGSLNEMLGYISTDVVGKTLDEYLTPREQGLLEDYLEFDSYGKDLGDILGRAGHFGMRNAQGERTEMHMKIERDVGYLDSPCFRITLQSKDQAMGTCSREVRHFLIKAKYDPVTDLHDQGAFVGAMEIVDKYVTEGSLQASIAVIAALDYNYFVKRKTQAQMDAMLQEISRRLAKTFRDSDIRAYLGLGVFAVGLLKADAAVAHIPLHRFREQMQFIGIDGEEVAVNITYMQCYPNRDVETTLKDCILGLELHVDKRNMLLAV